MNRLNELLNNHEEYLKSNNWVLFIIILALFWSEENFNKLEAIITKLENGTLTKENILKKEANENGTMGRHT